MKTTKKQLERAKKDVVYFAKSCHDIKLSKAQREIIDAVLSGKRILILKGRVCGYKTMMRGLKCQSSK